MLLALFAVNSTSLAAPRDSGKADNAAVLKLQGMVKSLTTEREAAKAEIQKAGEELEKLKKEHAESLTAISAVTTARDQLNGELEAQKSGNVELRDRLEKTQGKLQEAYQKNKELSDIRAQLTGELATLNAKQQSTEQQLNTCTEHNVRLYESGKDLLGQYEKKGTIGALMQDEPLLQFHSVEMENIVQDYEDKLKSGVYKSAGNPEAKPQ